MTSLNPLAPAKKYRITYQGKSFFADVVDYNAASGVLTADGRAMMIFHPDQLRIAPNQDILFR